MLGTEAHRRKVAALREELGLNDPVLVQYGRWAAGLLHGDMGTSYSYRMPVTGMVANKIPVTITLTLMAFVLMVVISIPLGIYTAKHEGGVVDRIIYIINQIIMAIPPFFSGILITLIFGRIFKLFTPEAMYPMKRILPALSVISFSRQQRLHFRKRRWQ